jgi:hypothetical protein
MGKFKESIEVSEDGIRVYYGKAWQITRGKDYREEKDNKYIGIMSPDFLLINQYYVPRLSEVTASVIRMMPAF